jgi:hypothetical protein
MTPQRHADPTPWAARLYTAARPRFARAQRALDGLFTGAFLGLMDARALGAIDEHFYATHRERLEGGALLYTDPAHIRRGLVEWERDVLTRYVPVGGRLVITGAGAGREVLGALDLGLDPFGFEPHPDLCEAGGHVLAAVGAGHRLARSSRDVFPHDAGPADAVLVGWTSYSHIAGRERRTRFLRDARARLRPGAPLVLSFWAFPTRPSYFRVVELASRVARVLTLGERRELGDVLAPGFFHCFTQAEIEGELAAAGFRCVEFAFEPYPHAVGVAV